MKISLNWIEQFVDLGRHSSEKLGELLTLHTAEVEEVDDIKASYQNMVIGKVIKLSKHPDANKLQCAQVDIGSAKPVQVVCGGQNLTEGMKVAVALPGAWVRWHGEGEPVQLSETKIRGEKSFGMICAGEEIGLESDNPEGQLEVRIKDLSFLKNKPGTPLATALQKNDTVLDIDNKSLTNRPDLWSHYGMAREFSTILKKPLKSLAPFLKYDKGAPKKSFKITIKAAQDCPRFSGCVITGVHVTDSPQWMKARLQAAGLRPINNLVDLTNYVMLELGEPMHAYDRGIVSSDELIVRHATKGETLETIDHKKRKLTEDDLIITNKKGQPLGLAGVMGGVGSEITDATTEIILEAANFNPVTVRKMSTRHGLRSDASQRFEKGLDPTLTDQAIARALVLLKETCPHATLVTPITTAGNWKSPKIQIAITPEKVVNKVGVHIPTQEMKRILTSLGFLVSTAGNKLRVTVPSHRATGDISLPEDLVEEIARIFGYANIKPLLPHLPAKLPIENGERFHKHATRNILAKILGFTEVMNYSFYNEDLFHKCGLQEIRHIKVMNPLSSDQTHMRVSLVPGMLQSLLKNSHERDHLKLFEIGRTYREIGTFMPLEEKWITAAVAQRKKYEPFYEIKEALDTFLKIFRPGKIQLRDSHTPPPYAHPKKCLEITLRGEVIGHVFELHPGVARSLELEHRTGLFELNFTKLVTQGREPQTFQPLPKFPGMSFDISFLIDKKTKVGDLEKTIRRADPLGLIHAVHLFDMYHGAGIPETKKSLAFSIGLRHHDHTLSDTEFQQTHQAVIAAVKKSGGELRGQ